MIPSDKLPPLTRPLSYGVKAGGWVFTAGMLGLDSAGNVVGTSPGRLDVEAQTRKTLENLRLCMEALGGRMDDIVKVNASITDYRMAPAFNEEYAKFFTPPYPARTTVIRGLAQGRMVVEIEAIAVLGASQSAVAVTGPAR